MASVVMLIGGALVNALAFPGSRVGIHCSMHDWNQRSFILPRELNYITSCNIIIF